MKIRNIAYVAMFTALTAAGAFIRIPFVPAAITLQALITLLAGMILGAKLGALSQIIYVVLGLCGLPIFASGGGIGYVLLPSFGYVAALPIAAAVCGVISQKGGFWRMIAAAALGLLCIYAVGVPYMYCIMRFVNGSEVDTGYVLVYGMALFLPGDALKCVAAALISPRLRRFSAK